MKKLLLGAAGAALVLATPAAHAQSAPPPGYQAPPPGYQAPPPGYQAPPPGYPPPAPAGPKVIRSYVEGDPIPFGYHPESRIRLGLTIGGATTFGLVYLFTALTAAAINDTKASADVNLLYIPIAGPFAQISRTKDQALILVEVLDGLAQAGGLAMFVCGLALPKTVLVRNDVGSLSVTPMAVGSGWGLGAVGTF